MGGRRARSLSEIVGTGLGAQQASFTRAIEQENPEAIAVSSAKLVAKSDKIADILYYASKLAEFVLRESKTKHDLDHEGRMRLARQEWSRVKKEEGLEDDPVVTNALVNAVAKAIGRGRKK
jgi:hypothetical protein